MSRASRVTTFSASLFVALLALALLIDLSMITMGGMTADAYYLPLRSVPVGEHREEIESVLVETHGRLTRHQRRLWLVIHGSALAGAIVVLAACFRGAAGPDLASAPSQRG